MAPFAHVLGFGGGVALEGAADTQRVDELETCDGYDIGTRGALIAARDVADYVTVKDLATVPAAWTKVFDVHGVAGNNYMKELLAGEGLVVATARYLVGSLAREGAVSPISGAADVLELDAPIELGVAGAKPVVRTEGVVATVAAFPGVYAIRQPAEVAKKANVFLVNFGAREGFAANLAPGLYVVTCIPPSTDFAIHAISRYDSLGTGERGEYKIATNTAGTKAKQLYFRGVCAYKSFAVGWGFDYNDATDREGPAVLMFANIANPLKWGNDDQGVGGTDREFTDSDRIPIGDGGETIRAGLSFNERLYIGTDKQMHFLAGDGRDSFITDGANPVAKSENVLGAHCFIEGPDKLAYGCGDFGLWAFDGNTFERHHTRLRDFTGRSPGWWDLIWTDRLRSDVYPGKTNGDLVWMQADYENEQVVVGVPWCNATSGRGYGTDTVVIKFNVRTKGFTRQVFAGVQYTAADYVRRQRQFSAQRFFATATAAAATVKRYGAPNAGTGKIASPLPSTKIGPRVLYGPNSRGVYGRVDITLAWEPPFSGLDEWTLRVNPDPVTYRDVIWTGTRFVACGNGIVGGIDTYHPIARSADGITWASIANATLDNGSWFALARAATLGVSGRLVVIHDLIRTGGDEAAYSDDDGATWTNCVTPVIASGGWKGIVWSPTLSLFVVVGGNVGAIMTSPDGIVWTARATPSVSAWTSVTWAPALLLLVAVSVSGNVMTSVNGTAWVNSATLPAGNFRKVIWSSRLALLVAVGDAGLIATSPDGTTWTVRVSPAALDWFGLADATELALMVATARSGVGNRTMSSADGITWALAASPADNDWNGVAWSSTLAILAACASTGGNRFMTNTLLPATPSLVFDLTPYVDKQAGTAVRLTVSDSAPAAPADGDIWVDVSGTDTSLGNATAGTLIAAGADYLVKRRYRNAWQYTGFGGQKGERVTVPLSFTPQVGTRFSVNVAAVSANRRWQIEGLGTEAAA